MQLDDGAVGLRMTPEDWRLLATYLQAAQDVLNELAEASAAGKRQLSVDSASVKSLQAAAKSTPSVLWLKVGALVAHPATSQP